MASTEPGREASDEPRLVASIEPRFTAASGTQRLRAAPSEPVVYVEPATIHEAFSRYWLLILLIAVIGAAAGTAQAMSKSPAYTASARLGVGMTNVNTPAGLGGFASSGPVLAAAYSRAATAQPVIDSVAKKLDMAPADVRSTVAASSIPETPVIRVDAVAQTENESIALANAMGGALVRYAGDTAQIRDEGETLLRRYRSAQRELETIRSRVTRAEERLNNGGGADAARALRSVRADASAASLRVRTLGASYQTSQQNLSGANPVQVLELAATAASDQRSVVLKTGFLGGAIGLVVGSALALLLANRRRRRALA